MVKNNRWVTLCYSRTAKNMLKVGWGYWDDVCFNFHSLVTRHILPELDTCTHILLYYYRLWTAGFANPCPTIAMQSLDPGDQEDRVPHCVNQPVVLLLPFHMLHPVRITKLTTFCWIYMFVLVQLVMILPFLWCYVNRLAILYGTQWNQKYWKLYAPPTTCNSATSHWHADRPLYNIYTHEYFHGIRGLYMCTQSPSCNSLFPDIQKHPKNVFTSWPPYFKYLLSLIYDVIFWTLHIHLTGGEKYVIRNIAKPGGLLHRGRISTFATVNST